MSVVGVPRFIEKFASLDGAVEVTFDRYEYEWAHAHPVRRASAPVAGADFAHDYLGFGSAPVNNSEERLRFYQCVDDDDPAALETALSNLIARCHTIGKGYLYKRAHGGGLVRKLARISNGPGFTIATRQGVYVPVIVSFECSSWWMDYAGAYDETFPVDATTEEFTVTNPGNMPTWDAVIRIRASDTNAVTFPLTFTNERNGMAFTLDRDDFTTADEELRIDCGADLVEYSDDDGDTYAADPGTISYPSGQTRIMRFEPGANPISVTTAGTPDYDIDIDFIPLMA